VNATFDQIAERLQAARRVLLVAHVNPDADALGSTLATGMALEALGIAAQVTFPDEPFDVPSGLKFLPRQDLFTAPQDADPADVVLAMDASSGDRIGSLLKVGEVATDFIAIDHHASFVPFAPIVHVDATRPATGGHLTAYPCGAAVPIASAVNFAAGESRANAAWVRLDGSGSFCVRASTRTHLVVDLSGYSALRTAGVRPVVANRVVDTRQGWGMGSPLTPGTTASFTVAALTDEPQKYRGALLLNVTVTRQSGPGHITLWPCGSAAPNASSLNFAAGRNRANAVAVAAGSDGRVCVRSTTAAHLVVDINAYVNPQGKNYVYRPAPTPPPPAPPALVAGMTPTEMAVVDLTNAARAVGRTCGSYGYRGPARPLLPQPQLAASAQRHSDDMAVRNFFSHTGSDGSSLSERIDRSGFRWSSAAENIAAGFTSPKAAVDALVASPGHCVNIMNPALTHIGVGYAVRSGSRHLHYWTQHFARPQ